jgi:uncharacterized protein (DUF4415 family)
MNKQTNKPRYLPKDIAKELRLSPKARILEKHEMHRIRADALEPRNIKVRVTMYLDLDIVEFFKELSEKGARYQTQINAVLREVMEKSTSAESKNPASDLRHAQRLITEALRKISRSLTKPALPEAGAHNSGRLRR